MTTKKKKLKELLHEKFDLYNSKNTEKEKILRSCPFTLLGWRMEKGNLTILNCEWKTGMLEEFKPFLWWSGLAFQEILWSGCTFWEDGPTCNLPSELPSYISSCSVDVRYESYRSSYWLQAQNLRISSMLTKKAPVLKGLQRLHLRNLKIPLLRSTRLMQGSNSKHLAVISWSSKKAKIWGTSVTISHDSDHYLGSTLESSFSNDSFSSSLDDRSRHKLHPESIGHSYDQR